MSNIHKYDYVTYASGSRVYKVTCVDGDKCILDSKYEVKKSKNLIKFNKLSYEEAFVTKDGKEGVIIGINYIKGQVYYIVRHTNIYKEISEQELLTIIKTNNENRLQEQETTERNRSISGIGRKLCSRNRIYVKFGHRGNEYCLNKSKERIKRYYDDLPLGQREISRR